MTTTKEYGLGVHAFPRGWFMVAEATEATKKPIALRFFGKDFVMYRGESGKVTIMDAYCPHMGTHIAKNESSFIVLDGKQVEGDDIRCPYHGWRFGPDGVCNQIPYSPAPIPKDACIPVYEVQEWGGVILMWHDEEGNKPDYQPTPLPEWEDTSWINWKIDHLGVLPVHGAEVVDNIIDKSHLAPIHGSSDMEVFEVIYDDHKVSAELAAGHRTLADIVLKNDTWYTGPGILMSRMQGHFPSIMLVCNTPVEDGTSRAWHGCLVKASTEIPSDEEVKNAKEFQEFSKLALMQDFDVWANKRACIQHMQVIGDGPFGKQRTWYSQFFNPLSEAKSCQEKVNGVISVKGTKRDPHDKPVLTT